MAERWAGRRAENLTRQCLIRDNYRCTLRISPNCAGRADTADHVVPKSRGGAMWDLSNLRAACRSCNSSKGAGVDEGGPVELPDWLT